MPLKYQFPMVHENYQPSHVELLQGTDIRKEGGAIFLCRRVLRLTGDGRNGPPLEPELSKLRVIGVLQRNLPVQGMHDEGRTSWFRLCGPSEQGQYQLFFILYREGDRNDLHRWDETFSRQTRRTGSRRSHREAKGRRAARNRQPRLLWQSFVVGEDTDRTDDNWWLTDASGGLVYIDSPGT